MTWAENAVNKTRMRIFSYELISFNVLRSVKYRTKGM